MAEMCHLHDWSGWERNEEPARDDVLREWRCCMERLSDEAHGLRAQIDKLNADYQSALAWRGSDG